MFLYDFPLKHVCKLTEMHGDALCIEVQVEKGC